MRSALSDAFGIYNAVVCSGFRQISSICPIQPIFPMFAHTESRVLSDFDCTWYIEIIFRYCQVLSDGTKRKNDHLFIWDKYKCTYISYDLKKNKLTFQIYRKKVIDGKK